MKRSLLKLLLLLLPFVAFAQNKTYLGLEVGPKFDVYHSYDYGDGIITRPTLYCPIFGFTLGQEISRIFTLETGFFVNNYGQSYSIRGQGRGSASSNAVVAYQIPLRLKARLNLIKEKFSLVTTVGYTFAINNDYEASGWGSHTTWNSFPFNDSTRSQYTSDYGLSRIYSLIETGLSLEFKTRKGMILSLGANYLAGLNRLVEMDVKYWINDEPEQTGAVFSNGDYFSIVLGLKYPISNIWAKKKAEIMN